VEAAKKPVLTALSSGKSAWLIIADNGLILSF
jgi:hypothetical protein